MGGEHAETIPETVLRHFSARADVLRDLALRNQDFRDMCQELDVAERALARIGDVPAEHRAARLTECLGWIERLKLEMEDALAEANVVPLSRPGRGR